MIDRHEKTPVLRPVFAKTTGAPLIEILHHLPGHATTGPIIGVHPAPAARAMAGPMKIAEACDLAGRLRTMADHARPGCVVPAATAKTVGPLRLHRQADIDRIGIAVMKTARIARVGIALLPPTDGHRHIGMSTTVHIARCTTTVHHRLTLPPVELTEIDTDSIGMRPTETTQTTVPRPPGMIVAARHRRVSAIGGTRSEALTVGLRMVGSSDHRIAGCGTERKTEGRRADGTDDRLHVPRIPMIGVPTIAIVGRPRHAESATTTEKLRLRKHGG